MQKFSAISKDVLDKALDKAIWWTEYVLRHNGARHLRSALLDLTWYEYLLLDVIAACLLITIAGAYLIYIIIRRILYHLLNHCSNTNKDINANCIVNKKIA
jgi:glucuronosyltransferase